MLLAPPALAGCLTAEPSSGEPGAGGLGSAPEGELAARAHGLALYVDANRSSIQPGEPVVVDYTVRNEGDATVWYNDACRTTWTASVQDAEGGPVQHTPYTYRCLALAWTSLEPGETVSYERRDGAAGFAWNGTLWEGTGSGNGSAEAGNGSYEPVDPGNYTLRGTFRYALERGGDLRNLTGVATVQVLPRNGTESGYDEVEVAAEADPDAISPGESVEVALNATNTGDRTVWHRSGCGHAWQVTMWNETGEEVQPYRPRAQCSGFEMEPLKPGEELPYPREGGSGTFGWNGRLWNGSAYVDAPPGNYTIQGAVPYRMQPDGDEGHYARGNATVRVTEGDGD